MFLRLLACLMSLLPTIAVYSAEMEQIPIEELPTDPALAKIVILTGAHYAANPAHQYYAGGVIVWKMLKQIPGVFPVLVKNGWPTNPAVLEDAKAIVVYMDNDDKAQPSPLLDSAHLDAIQKEIDRGCGFVTLHKPFALPKAQGERIAQWVGAYYLDGVSDKGHWDAQFTDYPNHPITRGVKPYKLNDGYCIQLVFNKTGDETGKGVTPLQRAPKTAAGKPGIDDGTTLKNVVTWAYERPDGGRGFAMSGAHSHTYFAEENLRRLAINGILWSAKIEVPANGTMTRFEGIDLKQNVEGPAAAAKKPAAN